MSGINQFADRLLRDMMRLSPDLAAEMGLRDVGGARLPVDTLPDYSDAGVAARRALMRGARVALRNYARPAAGEDAVTYDVLTYLLEEGLFGPFAGHTGQAFHESPYPLNHLTGAHPNLASMLTRDQSFDRGEDAEGFLARLEQLPAALDGVHAAFKTRIAEGVSPPRASMNKALEDMQEFASAPASDNMLLAAASLRLEGAGATSILAQAERIIANAVLPAYRRLIVAVEAAAPRFAPDQGLWAIPSGEAHYAWLLRAHTTTALTPDETHALGLEETARTQSALMAALANAGATGETLSARFSNYEQNGRARFGADRAEILQHAVDLMDQIERRARPLFRLAPKHGFRVEPIATGFENSLHHHYTPPKADGARPGLLRLNVASLLEKPRAPLVVLCAHEGIPGHHTQLTIAQELAHLPEFRRTIVFNAYIEGWAKYAETLLDRELMDDPHVRIARLQGELYSAVNLALDTGLHALRWSKANAIRFFQENTGADADFAEAIVDRSLVTPGQLCSYKIGMRAMLELRDRRRAIAGAAYDPRDFHDAVLQHGGLPLTLLESLASP